MTIEDYSELLTITKECKQALENYVIKYEQNKITKYTENILKVLSALNDFAINNADIEVYVIRAIHDISTAAVKSYEETELENAILNIRRFFMRKIPNFENYHTLGIEFNKYFH
jgi:hypothetical protein